ncbi:AraC family transcriptional regulator [Paenibacillus radicis (ex Xue et al. 2023)]|uniref:AraC family transcriptional regulator n=1 Tax=Paenibacillus radicis (ex Xue et al. 2023) TaxID=2972489 RepID=A0ABT1YA59_9BACL|nr:AraC family transcriptional regulator [Paenibacillus radicis (ex Xue et al. 2023)]MCR8630083.1 AraC family transcriptional regulator [Paenibacillus radicis (ex Xue et al. 2023)]
MMKKIAKPQRTVSFFHKSLIITLLISSIPMALLTMLTYYIGIREIEREVGRTQKLQYEQVSERMDAQLAHLKFTVNQWAYNPVFNDLKNRSISKDVRFTLDLYNQLIVMKSSNPLINQVSLFLDQEGSLLIDGENGSRTIRNTDEKNRYLTLLQQKSFMFWNEALPHSSNEKNSVAMSLIQKVPIEAEPSYGVLIVDLKKDEINALLQQLNPVGQGTAFLLKQNGSYLVTDSKHGMASTTSSTPDANSLDEIIRTEVIKHNQEAEAGTFLYSADKETYVVSYGKLKNTGWFYVSATPLSHLTKPVELISKLPLGASLIGLLLSVLLSWFASKQLYRPLQHLMRVFGSDNKSLAQGEKNEVDFIENKWNYLIRERTDLQFKMEKAVPALREGFMLQLVQGHLSTFSEQRIREEFEQFGIQIQDQQFSLLVIQLYGFTNSYSNFAKGDEQLITFAAANIVDEMAGQLSKQTQIINFQDLTIGVLFISPEDHSREQIKSELFEFARLLIEPLRDYLKLQVVIGLSRITTSLKKIPVILEDTRQAVRYRDIEMENSIIDSEDIVLRGEHSTHYPFIQEKMLIQSMQMGLRDQSMQLVEEFLEALQVKSSKEFVIQQGMLQLLGNVQFAMLQIGCNPQHIYNGVNLFEQLLLIREPAAMLDWFKSKLIHPFIEEMQSIKDLQTKQIVDKVIAMLNENFMQDISLEACADRFGTYPQKLSASFRQTVGVNFIDYLTNLRLEKSKELLISTDLKINDIAEQVGYQPTYYNRIFKKHEDITPGQYREKHAYRK